jgi:glycosyltransferase involved in cell wall biosynthesis
LKISIITAVYNRADCVADAVGSVQAQTWHNVEYIVIDGASTDGTLQVLQASLDERAVLVSEADEGIYDALNKGLALATGEVVGLMHSDDFYADRYVLELVAKAFSDPLVDAVYGDLDYVAKADTSSIVRHWCSGECSPEKLKNGWMPPHPTLFLRRRVIESLGGFDTRFKIAADYDAILRYFSQGKIQPVYIPRVLVKMRLGGESNRSLAKIWIKTREDYTALRGNKVGGIWALLNKNLRKISQFWLR